MRFYNKVAEDQEKRQAEYQKTIGRIITYKAVSYTHLDVYKRQIYNHGGEDLWSVKIQEIRDFQCGTNNEKIPVHLADHLVRI